MIQDIFFIVAGYCSGSLLFAQLTAKLFHKPAILQDSKDGNPGTTNAFRYGGFWCGTITLLGDLLKGVIPIYLYQKFGDDFTAVPVLSALVLIAPVLGHAFPVFYGFHGGKGIAVTFGCLLGLLPNYIPLVMFAGTFILFSTVLRITPHFHRTLITYLFTSIGLFVLGCERSILIGFLIITLTVCLRLYMSKEEKEKMVVKLLWMH